ncbi:hypothetical protein F2Q69_00022804 [Brassica cretica]|uniref:Uncharacterized protein n=1 Tax=Brassica cretica TaxID=69181 RepID=A0A8S9PYY5_BRACR|nr:hypothetical protein F2Q69_00022804 [Brassica cretica]
MKNAPSIDGTISTSIDTQPHHTKRKRSSTDIAYQPSIDTGVDRVREGDHSIGSWTDDYHHPSYVVETEIHEPRADEFHEGFTYEELLNMKRRDEADQHQAAATGEGTRFSHSIDRANHPSIDENLPSLIDIRPKAKPTHQLVDYMYGGDEARYSQDSACGRHTSITIDRQTPLTIDQQAPLGIDRQIALNIDRRRPKDITADETERASKDKHNYISLPEQASSFTQTKLVPEIYTKDEINEMFYGVCGAQEKNEGDEARHSQDSACGRHTSITINRQTPLTIDRQTPLGIDRQIALNIDRRRPKDLTPDEICLIGDVMTSISALTSKIEAIQGELVEIQSYIARRPEASIDRRNNKSTDILRQTSVEDPTNRLKIATMKENWRRGDEAIQDFTGTWFNKCREEMDTCFLTSSSFQHY